MTLKELSEKLNITVPNLSYYMKGREPSYDILIRIADYFNVTTDWLIGRVDSKIPIYDTITAEIENTPAIAKMEKLTGWNRSMYLMNQDILYNIMESTYALFSFLDEEFSKDFTKCIFYMFYGIKLYIEQMTISILESTKEEYLNDTKNLLSIADSMHSLMLETTHIFITTNIHTTSAHFDILSKNDKQSLLEMIEYIFSIINKSSNDGIEETLASLIKIAEQHEKDIETSNKEHHISKTDNPD